MPIACRPTLSGCVRVTAEDGQRSEYRAAYAESVVSAGALERLTHQNNPRQFGSEGRNAVRGPGYGNVDFSLFKNFVFAESNRLRFGAEASTAFNSANFALRENDLNSPAFGQILQAAPRHVVCSLL
jgi:hypothetical protein